MSERNPASLAKAQAMLRQHQAAEAVRQQQQGHGNPIVSWMDEVNGFLSDISACGTNLAT